MLALIRPKDLEAMPKKAGLAQKEHGVVEAVLALVSESVEAKVCHKPTYLPLSNSLLSKSLCYPYTIPFVSQVWPHKLLPLLSTIGGKPEVIFFPTEEEDDDDDEEQVRLINVLGTVCCCIQH